MHKKRLVDDRKSAVKIAWLTAALIPVLFLTACATAIPPQEAPCDAFGQHCEPKIPINQWQDRPC